MSEQPIHRMSYAEFLAFEKNAAEKHEYLRGGVWAMAGGTARHAQLQANVIGVLRTALRGKPCGAYSSDLRVRIDATDRTTYPDVSVVCGQPAASKEDPLAITNPTLLVEILSESTEASDRGEKFSHYTYLSSLKEYVLVSQDRRRVEVFRRAEGVSWSFTPYEAGLVPLESLGISVPLDEIYEDPNAAA